MRRSGSWAAGALGALLVVAGVLVFAAANRGAGDFGWVTYAPLEQNEPVPYSSSLGLTYFPEGWQVAWTGTHLLGAGLVVLVLAVLCGWLPGRRAERRVRPLPE